MLVPQAAHELRRDSKLTDCSILLGKDPGTFLVPRTGLKLTGTAMFLALI